METRVESGDPRDVICEMVQNLGVDVLVMGSHGYGWFKRLSLYLSKTKTSIFKESNKIINFALFLVN